MKLLTIFINDTLRVNPTTSRFIFYKTDISIPEKGMQSSLISFVVPIVMHSTFG